MSCQDCLVFWHTAVPVFALSWLFSFFKQGVASCKTCKASWKSRTGWSWVLEVSCSMICYQLELCCWVSVCSEGIQVLRVVQRSRYVQRYTSTGGENTFSIQEQSSSNRAGEVLAVLSLPGWLLLRQVKLESRALLSAVCQLAVNIYCFSCCKASSQHVREKCFNVLKAPEYSTINFFS